MRRDTGLRSGIKVSPETMVHSELKHRNLRPTGSIAQLSSLYIECVIMLSFLSINYVEVVVVKIQSSFPDLPGRVSFQLMPVDFHRKSHKNTSVGYETLLRRQCNSVRQLHRTEGDSYALRGHPE